MPHSPGFKTHVSKFGNSYSRNISPGSGLGKPQYNPRRLPPKTLTQHIKPNVKVNKGVKLSKTKSQSNKNKSPMNKTQFQ